MAVWGRTRVRGNPMTTPIRTRWHHLTRLIKADEVYLIAPPGGKSQRLEAMGGKLDVLQSIVDQIGTLPKFVIDPELDKLTVGDAYHKSLLDMKKADVLHLPFPGLIVEMPKPAFAQKSNQAGD